MNVGRAIKLLLDKKGLTQKELSEKSGISATSISLILKGHTQPRKENLESIAKALDAKPEFLLFLSITKEDVPEDRQFLYDFIWPQMEATFIKIFIK